jgi:hypothetical protein
VRVVLTARIPEALSPKERRQARASRRTDYAITWTPNDRRQSAYIILHRADDLLDTLSHEYLHFILAGVMREDPEYADWAEDRYDGLHAIFPERQVLPDPPPMARD